MGKNKGSRKVKYHPGADLEKANKMKTSFAKISLDEFDDDFQALCKKHGLKKAIIVGNYTLDGSTRLVYGAASDKKSDIPLMEKATGEIFVRLGHINGKNLETLRKIIDVSLRIADAKLAIDSAKKLNEQLAEQLLTPR